MPGQVHPTAELLPHGIAADGMLQPNLCARCRDPPVDPGPALTGTCQGGEHGVQVFTVGVGVAYGQCAMLLASGTRGKRFMLPHATALLQQPRMPPTGARQAIEVQIRWREAYAQYQNHLSILSEGTGHSVEKLDYDMQRCPPLPVPVLHLAPALAASCVPQATLSRPCACDPGDGVKRAPMLCRPLYMTPIDAIEYGMIDKIVKSEKEEGITGAVMTNAQWDKQAGLVQR